MAFAALAGVLGSLAVALTVVPRPAVVAAASDGADDPASSGELMNRLRSRVVTFGAVSAGLGLLVSLDRLVWESNVVKGSGSLVDAARRLVAETRWGALWLAETTLLAGLVVLLWTVRTPRTSAGHGAATSCTATNGTTGPLGGAGATEPPGPGRGVPRVDRTLLLATAGALGLALTRSLTGHLAAPRSGRLQAVAIDVVHLAAAGVWIGGLAVVVFALGSGVRGLGRSPMAGATLRAFGIPAAVSVATVTLTGLLSSSVLVTSPDALLTTLYGRTLITKVGLVGLVGMIGLANSTAIRRRAIAARRLLISEAAVGAVVLLAAAVLTSAKPASGPAYETAGEVVATRTATLDDLVVNASVQPNRPGDNVVTVRAFSSRRPEPAAIVTVQVRLDNVTIELTELRAGRVHRWPPARAPRCRRSRGHRRAAPARGVTCPVRMGDRGDRHDLPAALSTRPLGPPLRTAALVMAIVALAAGSVLAARRTRPGSSGQRTPVRRSVGAATGSSGFAGPAATVPADPAPEQVARRGPATTAAEAGHSRRVDRSVGVLVVDDDEDSDAQGSKR